MKNTFLNSRCATRISALVVLVTLMVIATRPVHGQISVTIGPNGMSIVPGPIPVAPDPSAILDVVSSTKGMLIPRVALSSTNSASPISAPPATSLLVYNTATAGSGATAVTPGFYYWDAGWVRLSPGGGGGSTGDPWVLAGNNNATATSVLGTTNAFPLNLVVNNQKAGHIDFGPADNTFFGYQAGNLTTGGYNTAVGFQALSANTTGTYNTAIGNIALQSNTIGHDNTALGDETLSGNTTGSYNTAVGGGALLANTKGNDNTAIGNNALRFNTTGNQNTASGSYALRMNTMGSDNTATGDSALYSNTTGNYNSAHGNDALQSNLSGTGNTASGYKALWSNTTGSGNTASGIVALSKNTIGIDNTAFGENALRDNVTGNYNTATGAQALGSNTSGMQNTATGTQALTSNTIGSNNTADGDSALFRNTTGSANTANGAGALQLNISGTGNTASGYRALTSNALGTNNTALGYQADVNNSSLTNATAIGANTVATASNQVRLGDANVTTLYCQGAYVPTTTAAPNMVVLSTGQILRSTSTGGGTGVTFTHYIGELYLGGIIFYLWKDASNTEHGLVASLTDLTSAVWSSTSTTTGATSSWNGSSNTTLATTSGNAASVCLAVGSGWYLPSMDELQLLFAQSFIINKTLPASGQLANANYWSSTEYNSSSAVIRGFGALSQNQGSYPKNTTFNVRAVRSF